MVTTLRSSNENSVSYLNKAHGWVKYFQYKPLIKQNVKNGQFQNKNNTSITKEIGSYPPILSGILIHLLCKKSERIGPSNYSHKVRQGVGGEGAYKYKLARLDQFILNITIT